MGVFRPHMSHLPWESIQRGLGLTGGSINGATYNLGRLLRLLHFKSHKWLSFLTILLRPEPVPMETGQADRPRQARPEHALLGRNPRRLEL